MIVISAPFYLPIARKFARSARRKGQMEKTLRRFSMRRSHKPQPSELYPQYAALFRRMDTDNSGELSLSEIRTALVKDEDFARAAGAPTTLTRLAATAVAANIIDGADDSESVAINEFVAWLVLCNGQAQDALLEKAASAAAASGSGARDRVAYLPGHSKRAERRATWAADETRWEAVRQMLREDVLSRADTYVGTVLRATRTSLLRAAGPEAQGSWPRGGGTTVRYVACRTYRVPWERRC